eukprot:1141038-Pelagomonas_calceolata.AAC.5
MVIGKLSDRQLTSINSIDHRQGKWQSHNHAGAGTDPQPPPRFHAPGGPIQELRVKSESCEEVLAGAEQKHKAETRQLKESLWARDEEVRIFFQEPKQSRGTRQGRSTLRMRSSSRRVCGQGMSRCAFFWAEAQSIDAAAQVEPMDEG